MCMSGVDGISVIYFDQSPEGAIGIDQISHWSSWHLHRIPIPSLFQVTITLQVSNGKCFINDQHIKINHFWFSLYQPSMKHKSWKHTLPSRHVLAPSLIAFMLSHCLPNLLRAVTVTNRLQHCLRFCRQFVDKSVWALIFKVAEVL